MKFIKSYNILVFNADKSSGANFIRSLKLAEEKGNIEYKIYGTATNPVRACLAKSDFTLVLTEHENKKPLKIIDMVKAKYNVELDLVYQTKSAEQMLLFSMLREEVPTFLPSHTSLKLFEDKFATYQKVKAAGFAVPETIVPETKEEIADFLEKQNGEVWVRKIYGQGGKGAFASTDANQITNVISKDNGWGSYSISERLPKQIVTDWASHLSEELNPGEMVTWIALYNNGKLIASQVRKRLYWEHAELTESGVTGYTGANMTISRDDIHALSEQIIFSCDSMPHGAMGIDFVIDKNGVPKLTEIQSSRFFTSTYPLALLGLNLPELYVKCFFNMEVPQGLINPCKNKMIYVQRFGNDGIMVESDSILQNIMEKTF